ncbi:MAG TPA: SRPBCC domain-containing protein [Candidatus Saccharimonadales bacterium]|jgi:uncharacterized protein YndB with AHSA1/START domain
MSDQTPMQVAVVDNKITLSRTYDAPKELVFSMFKNPEQLAKWWGPAEWPATIAAFDFTEGGVWHYYMTGPDDTKAWGKATFKTIDEPNSLSFVDVFSDEQGTVDSKLPEGEATFTFDETDGKTTLSSISTYQTAEEVQKLVEMGMLEGVKDTWNQLDTLIDASQKSNT